MSDVTNDARSANIHEEWRNEYERVNASISKDGGSLWSYYNADHTAYQKWRSRFKRLGLTIQKRQLLSTEQRHEHRKAYKRKYYAAWRAANTDRIQAYHDTYWRKRLEIK